MNASAGRKARIAYHEGDGTGAGVNIAKARSDGATINNEPMDGSSKDDGAWRSYLNDIGAQSIDMTCAGVMSDDTLLKLAMNVGPDSALHWLSFLIDGVGTFKGQFFINSFSATGDNGTDPVTFEAAFASSGTITYTSVP